MAEVDQRLGITPPISTTLPTEQDNQANTAMVEELRRQNTFESPSDTQKRQAGSHHDVIGKPC
jgi:poly(A) polymerase